MVTVFKSRDESEVFTGSYAQASGAGKTQREVAESVWKDARAYFTGRRDDAVENDVQRLTVDEFISARHYIERQLKTANPRSSADFSGAAERLMKLGIIDFRAVDRLLNPPKTILDEAYAEFEGTTETEDES